jgi:succinoglycan biosynthesis transport protein ExoP
VFAAFPGGGPQINRRYLPLKMHMLQVDKSPLGRVGEAAEGGSAFDARSSAELFATFSSFIRRQFPVLLWAVLVTLGLAVVYLITAPPMYTGLAKMIIDTGKVQLFQQQSILSDVPVDSATVESEIEIMKSENVALSVIKDLHLDKDPEFVGSSGGLIGSAISLVLSPFSSDEPKSELDLSRRALTVFQKRLTVRRVGLTYVMEISFESLNPDRAAQVANAVASAYIDDKLEAKYQTTRRAAVWLQDRLKELLGQASTAERAVVDYKSKNNIIDTGGPGNRLVGQQQVTELNTGLMQAHAATAEAKARLDRVTQILRSNPDPSDTATATVADTLHNDVITKLRQQYLDIAQREADWSNKYGANHLAVVNLRNQMQEIRKSIADELKRIAESYQSDYDIAKAREDSIAKSLDTSISASQVTNEAQIELHGLESTAQTYRTLYDNFLQRYMESVQQQSFPITEARVITQAARPQTKSSPKSSLILAVAAMGGLMLGLGLAMLRDISDRVFRTGRQVEDLIKTECLAIIPMINPDAEPAIVGTKAASDRVDQRTGSASLLRHLDKPFDRVAASMRAVNVGVGNVAKSTEVVGKISSPPDLTTAVKDRATARKIAPVGVLRYFVDSPFSRFAESIRAVKVSADLDKVTRSNKVIGVTSSLPDEGKSTIAAALALLCAQGGARVILVDCDLRKPSLSRELSPNAGAGLLEVVTEKVGLDDVIWSDPTSRLSFLPVVVKSRLAHTSEVLASDGIKRLFERLRESYDYVIVDLSPIIPVVDVRSTVHFIDSYLFVIEWGKTKIGVVENALNTARGVYDNLLGVVLSKANLNVLGRYESHLGNSSYNSYYARYGVTD